MKTYKVTIILLAGGGGSRMNLQQPKQFLTIHTKPLWYYSVDPFLEIFPSANLIWVLPSEFIKSFEKTFFSFFPNKEKTEVKFIQGGKTRYHSSQNAVQIMDNDTTVFIHDVARCLIDKNLIQKLFMESLAYHSAVPFIFASDSVRIKNNEKHHEIVDRKKIMLIQTPQVFKADILKKSFEQISYHEHITDDASVVEEAGFPLHFVEGYRHNIKITFAEDLEWAKWILSK